MFKCHHVLAGQCTRWLQDWQTCVIGRATLGEEKVQAHTDHIFWSLPCWGSALEAASLLLIHCPSRHSGMPRNPLPPPGNPWWLLLVNYTATTQKLQCKEALQGKKKHVCLSPQTENANRKTRKEDSKDQAFPCSCPRASLPSRKISSLLTPSLLITTILTFLLSSPLSCLSEPLIHLAWTTAALLRGAVSENRNNSHQCLKAPYTRRADFKSIFSLSEIIVLKKETFDGDSWLLLNKTDLEDSDKLNSSLLFKIKKQNRYMQAWIVKVQGKSSQRWLLKLQERARFLAATDSCNFNKLCSI